MNNPCQTHANWAFKTFEERLTALEGGPQGEGGPHTHEIEEVTGLQTALDAKGTSNFSGSYVDLTNKPATFPPEAHNQAISTVTGLQEALDGKQASGSYALSNHNHDAAYEAKNDNIQQHVASAHAPANAQKNSDITKAEIEAVLTGVIGTHSHAGGGADPFVFKAVLAANAATGANVTPISLTGFTFNFAANKRYFIDIAGATQAPAATTGSGFHLDTSVAVTRVGMTHVMQLANTGTVTAGSSIADDVSVGVSSGRPSVNVDTPVMGSGYLLAGANAGTATLRYRSEVAAVSTVMAGFMMRVMEMP